MYSHPLPEFSNLYGDWLLSAHLQNLGEDNSSAYCSVRLFNWIYLIVLKGLKKNNNKTTHLLVFQWGYIQKANNNGTGGRKNSVFCCFGFLIGSQVSVQLVFPARSYLKLFVSLPKS